MIRISVYTFLLFNLLQISAQQAPTRGDIRIVFYNTENLFDTIDNPNTNDQEFLPNGDKKWNTYRYWKKIKQLYQVLAASGGESPPEIIGLCEVESLVPLQHLVNKTPLSKYSYSIIHRDSPDERGIDVALLYRNDKVRLISKQFIQVNFKENTAGKTREILYTKLKIESDTLHVFVNHWPSRRGGELKSESKRMAVAQVLRAKTDSILQLQPGVKLVIMGDFNDEPSDNSLKKLTSGGLVNLSAQLKANCKCGSYKYESRWQMFDQIIVSPGLFVTKGLHTSPEKIEVFRPPFLLEKDAKYGGTQPVRTYQGPRYKGGFSDHLPVMLDLLVSKN